MIGKLLPYFEISNDVGFSGKHLKTKKFWKLWYIGIGESQTVPFCTEPVMKSFNPFRDLQRGGTTIGIKGKNYWFADDTVLGWLIKLIFI